MSQSAQHQPTPGQAPKPPQQQGGFGPPPRMPGAAQDAPAAQGLGGAPPAPAGNAGPPQNALLALGIALVAAVALTFLYGMFQDWITNDEGELPRKAGWIGVVVGAAVGAGPAFLAKRNIAVQGAGVVLAFAAVFFATLFAGAILVADGLAEGAPAEAFNVLLGTDVRQGDGAFAVLTGNAGALIEVWTDTAGFMDWFYLALGPLGALGIAGYARKPQEKQARQKS